MASLDKNLRATTDDRLQGQTFILDRDANIAAETSTVERHLEV